MLAAFRRAYPEIVLDVVVSNQALNLSKRDADVAVRATDRPPEALIGRRVGGIAWAVFAARNIAPSSNSSRTRATHDWIGFGDNLAGSQAGEMAARSMSARSGSSIASTPCWGWRKRRPPASGSR